MTKGDSDGVTSGTGRVVSSSSAHLFEPEALAADLRVRQADFARMCGVSRQTVSMWVKKGKITSIYPDGTFCPRQAAREVIRNTRSECLRAKVFRVFSEDAEALRLRVADLERELLAQEERCRLTAAAFDAFKGMLMERKRWICADGGARYAAEVDFTVEAAWFDAIHATDIDAVEMDDEPLWGLSGESL